MADLDTFVALYGGDAGRWLKQYIDAHGGGGSAGSPIVRKFPFTHATPNLLTGAALYTPTIGDVLLDAWIEIDTAWDGTTPLCDIGTFVGQNFGLFVSGDHAVDMTFADTDTEEGSGLLQQNYDAFHASLVSTQQVFTTPHGNRNLPGKFIAANPIKVCVSQDGTNTGADPGSTVGSAVLYLVTATPV